MNTDEARKLAVEAKARADAATPGPWLFTLPEGGEGYTHGALIWGEAKPSDISGWVSDGIGIGEMAPTDDDYSDSPIGGIDQNSNGIFVTAARADVPALADALIAALEEVERLTSPVTWRQLDYEDGDAWECSGCQAMTVWEDSPEENDVKFCSGCGHPVIFEHYQDPFNDYDESWDDTP